MFSMMHYTGNSMECLRTINGLVAKATGGFTKINKNVVALWGKPRDNKLNTISNDAIIINHPLKTAIARSKLRTLNTLSAVGCSVVPYTTSYKEALVWARNGDTVYARTKLNSFGGKGIVVITPETVHSMYTMADCALFTLGIPYEDCVEYRVHAGRNSSGEVVVIDITQKKRRNGWKDLSTFSNTVRNYKNGWVYCRMNSEVPGCIITESRKAIKYTGVEFGAVDIIYRRSNHTPYILEVNTAPGLDSPTTIQKYAEFFTEIAVNV